MQSIKWISLFSIFLLSTITGNIIARKYKNRVNELKELKVILNTIETKIKFTQQPLTEIFKEIADNPSNKETIKLIFKETYERLQKDSLEIAWKQAISENQDNLNLVEEDIKIIEGMGRTLGKTDIEGQIKEIEVIKEFLFTQIEKAEGERTKNEKMYKTLGGIVGIGMVIILI